MATKGKDAAETRTHPEAEANPLLKSYYESLESRIGYRLVLGGTRHFGYYEQDTYWPFPIGRALRAMEKKLLRALDLPKGSQVLDAGCGVGHVALYLAQHGGLRVTGIDLIDHHVVKVQRNIARSGLPPGQVTAQKMDYQHLDALPDASHDGVFTMETFVHATDPEAALAGFYRVLRPGGKLALFEYDHTVDLDRRVDPRVVEGMHFVNEVAAMPTNTRSHPGVFKRMLEEAGFEDVKVEDYSRNIRPMLRLFCVMAFVPFWLVWLLRLERFFVNTVAGAHGYRYREHWRYVAVTARKPAKKE